MLTDNEIEQAAGQLKAYRENDTLSQILNEYSVLIEDYKRLKSDYEEERDARERYKQIAKGGERNPFAVALIDGDGYVFNENLVSQGDAGGSRAAQLLNQSIKSSLQRKGLDHCQVIVRVYANITGLSKALHKAGLVGNEKRSLSTFVAGFNRSYGLADFVDAGEFKENADFKLRALLNLYADNPQCKHVYFAACHDVGYVSDITPHRGDKDKFTLINAPGVRFHEEFTKLSMQIEELPDVFRLTPLESATPYRPAGSMFAPPKPPVQLPQLPKISSGTPSSASIEGQSPVCRFYPQGKCKYGKSCKNLHLDHVASTLGSLQESHSKANPEGLDASLKPHLAPPLDWFSLRKLPQRDDILEGHIFVNDSNFRLDPYIPPTASDFFNRLKQRIDRRRVCNNFHLNGHCVAGDLCEYDHEPLTEGTKRALESLARSTPCPKRGLCKNSRCTRGHICQIQDCSRRGGKAYCKLPVSSHHVDLAVARCIPGDNASPPQHVPSPTDSYPESTYSDDFLTYYPETIGYVEEREAA